VYRNQKGNTKLQLRDATMLSNALAIRLHTLREKILWYLTFLIYVYCNMV